MNRDNNSKGIVLILIAMSLFAIQDSLIKYIFEQSAFYLKEDPVKEEKDDKVDVLQEYQDMRDRERAEELKRLREEDNKVKFTSVEPFRKDPNRGMRFLKKCSDPINVGKLGSSRSFIKKRDREYY